MLRKTIYFIPMLGWQMRECPLSRHLEWKPRPSSAVHKSLSANGSRISCGLSTYPDILRIASR